MAARDLVVAESVRTYLKFYPMLEYETAFVGHHPSHVWTLRTIAGVPTPGVLVPVPLSEMGTPQTSHIRIQPGDFVSEYADDIPISALRYLGGRGTLIGSALFSFLDADVCWHLAWSPTSSAMWLGGIVCILPNSHVCPNFGWLLPNLF